MNFNRFFLSTSSLFDNYTFVRQITLRLLDQSVVCRTLHWSLGHPMSCLPHALLCFHPKGVKILIAIVINMKIITINILLSFCCLFPKISCILATIPWPTILTIKIINMINGQNGHPQCNVTIIIKIIQISQASLAAVIITAVVSSVEYEVVKPIWKSKSKIFRNITCGDI